MSSDDLLREIAALREELQRVIAENEQLKRMIADATSALERIELIERLGSGEDAYYPV